MTLVIELLSRKLRQFETHCVGVFAKICRSVARNSDLVEVICSMMPDEDATVASDAHRELGQEIVERPLTDAFRVLVGIGKRINIQDVFMRRIGEAN